MRQRHFGLLDRRAVRQVGQVDQELAGLSRLERLVLEEILDPLGELCAREPFLFASACDLAPLREQPPRAQAQINMLLPPPNRR